MIKVTSSISRKNYPAVKGKAHLGVASAALCIHWYQGLMDTAQLPATVELASISDLTPAIILCHKNRTFGDLLWGQERAACWAKLQWALVAVVEMSLTGWVWVLLAVHGACVCILKCLGASTQKNQLSWQLLPEFHKKIFGKSHADMFILLAVRMSKCESWMLSFSLNGAIVTTHEIWQNKYIFTHDFCQTHINPLFICCPKWL